MEYNRTADNARRLAGVLYRFGEDPATLNRLAAALNYHKPQLEEDIKDLYTVIKEALQREE